MFMKRILYLSCIYQLLLVCAIIVVSCGNEEVYDIYGGTENKVYIPDPGSTVLEVLHTPVSSVGDVKMKVSVHCTNKANGEIQAVFAVDNTLVEDYNIIHETDYAAVAIEILDMKNPILVIASNAMAAKQEMEISIAEENLALLKNADRYLIPIRLKEVLGNATLSTTTSNVVYISIEVTTVEGNYQEGVTLEDIHANFIADDIRSGWEAELSGLNISQTNGPAKLFDGITNVYQHRWWFESKSSPVDVIVDMQKVYDDIIGCRLIGIAKGVEVNVSVDKETWTKIGTTISTSPDIVFYIPVQLRYVKFTFPIVESWSIFGGVTKKAGGTIHEFYACTKK